MPINFRQSSNHFRARKGQLRRKLIREIVIILTIMGAIAYTVFFLLDKQYRYSFAATQTDRSSKESVQRYQNFIEPLIRSLTVAREWGESGLVNIGRKDDISLKYIPLLKQLPQVEALLIGDSNGHYYELHKRLSGWTLYRGIQHDDVLQLHGKSLDSTLCVLDQFSEESEQNLTDSEWYKAGLEAIRGNQFIWTTATTPLMQEMTYIFASTAWEKDSLVTVFAFQVRLMGFIELMAAIRESEDKTTFFFDRRVVLYNDVHLSTKAEKDSTASLVPYSSVNDTIINAFLGVLQKNDFVLEEPARIQIDGEAWWGAYHPLNREQGVVKVGCLINEKRVTGNLSSNKLSVYLVFTIGFLLALLFIFMIFRRYVKNMDRLIYRRINSKRIDQEIPEIISRGEGPTVEFKSTMRMNLKSGKFGKEIEHAWLKTIAAYLNSDGGLLMIGVNDEGEIIGLDADNFENDDHCRLHLKNVFNQHIGSELSRYVRMNIHEIAGKKIVIIECDPSPEPAFLNSKNDEEAFYIRSGPSSIKLSVSKSIKYIRGREAEKVK